MIPDVSSRTSLFVTGRDDENVIHVDSRGFDPWPYMLRIGEHTLHLDGAALLSLAKACTDALDNAVVDS